MTNARPQKRLEILQDVVGALHDRQIDAHAIIIGNMRGQFLPQESDSRIHFVGPRADPFPWYDAADVYVCTSDYEGFSLSQIEALSAGLYVVSRQVGGSAELSANSHRYKTVPEGAGPDDFSDVIADINVDRVPIRLASFTVLAMSARYSLFYHRTAEWRSAQRSGFLLISNDNAVGGAQSSARRLLLAFSKVGVPCFSALLAENRENSTAGTVHLRKCGVQVFAPERTVRRNIRRLADWAVSLADHLRVRTIVFWNAIVEAKLRICDKFVFEELIAVSPGEMYFRSLERYFQRPSPDIPYYLPADYGALLRCAVVKYLGEAAIARACLGSPVRVIPNGVEQCVPRTRRAFPKIRLGTMVRIFPDKKLEQLIDTTRIVVRNNPDFELMIAGAPDVGAEEYALDLRARVADLPVKWLGHMDPNSFLPNLDAFVLVSEPAGCPNASLEAMAVGLPIVATDAGGAAEQVEPGKTGWLTPRGDVAALASALEEALSDTDRLEKFGRAGLTLVRKRFGVDQMYSSYASLFGVF